MQCLIDADVIRYEIGFAAEAGWQQPGFPSWDYVEELLTNRINNICAITNATKPPILFLTGPTNFRYEVAKRKGYKLRPSLKPWHFKNLSAYISAVYDMRMSVGMEADDCMALEQISRPNETIICTRDKDLRAVPGWHYGWELGNQPQFGPELVDELGRIYLSADRKSIKGTGLLFFYAQCLVGDPTDTILGIERCGPVKAFEILNGCVDTLDAFKRVREAYRAVYGDRGDEFLLESGRLLWMTRELNEDGTAKLWEFPIG